jgi:hypothetical protein
LTEKEKKDKEKITQIKSFLQKSKTEGERVDELLMSKFSEANYLASINASINKKQEEFENEFKDLRQSINLKKGLSRRKDFECKQAINDYCVRISDINGFFALFSIPEGIVADGDNGIIQKFKDKNEINALFGAIRNYITKKDAGNEKIKVTFDNPTFLGGWAYKTTDYCCRILKKQDNYYLLIIGKEKSKNKNDVSKQINVNSLTGYQMMDYYQQKGQTIFGSVYTGKFDSKYGDDRTKLKNSEFIKRIEQIIDGLNREFCNVQKVKMHLESLKEMIRVGKFNFGITASDFGKAFLGKTEKYYHQYKNKKGILNKEDVIISILKELFGSEMFDYGHEKDYLVNRVKEIMKEDAPKTSFLGSDLLAYEVTKLEPYYYKNNFREMDFKKDGIDEKLLDKELFIFQIYCKDFSLKRGSIIPNPKKDLNTLEFEELFLDRE